MSIPNKDTLLVRFAEEIARDKSISPSQLADQYEYLVNEGHYTYAQLMEIAGEALRAPWISRKSPFKTIVKVTSPLSIKMIVQRPLFVKEAKEVYIYRAVDTEWLRKIANDKRNR